MFHHVLVPLDLSARNRRVLALAADLADADGGRITLLHVIARVENVPLAEMRGFYKRIAGHARRRMTAAIAAIERRGIAVSATILIGAPAGEIVRYAQNSAVDLILMRSHRIEDPPSAAGLGTTSYKVAVACRCPVMLVK